MGAISILVLYLASAISVTKWCLLHYVFHSVKLPEIWKESKFVGNYEMQLDIILPYKVHTNGIRAWAKWRRQILFWCYDLDAFL